MNAMLGIKLDGPLERRIAEFARSRGQAKSEVGRRALIEYLDRHSLEDEFRRQLAMLKASGPEDIADLEQIAFDNPEWK